jgi:hypothetical protein
MNPAIKVEVNRTLLLLQSMSNILILGSADP